MPQTARGHYPILPHLSQNLACIILGASTKISVFRLRVKAPLWIFNLLCALTSNLPRLHYVSPVSKFAYCYFSALKDLSDNLQSSSTSHIPVVILWWLNLFPASLQFIMFMYCQVLVHDLYNFLMLCYRKMKYSCYEHFTGLLF